MVFGISAPVPGSPTPRELAVAWAASGSESWRVASEQMGSRRKRRSVEKSAKTKRHRPKALDLSLTLLRSSRPGFGFGLGLGLFFLKCRGKLILQKIPEVITG